MENWIAFVAGLCAGIAVTLAATSWGLLRTVEANTTEAELVRVRMRLLSAEIHGALFYDTVTEVGDTICASVRMPFMAKHGQN